MDFKSCFCKAAFELYYIYFHNFDKEGFRGTDVYILSIRC